MRNGFETAEAIAFRCNGKVSIVEMMPDIVADLRVRKILKEYSVEIHTSAKVVEIGQENVIVEQGRIRTYNYRASVELYKECIAGLTSKSKIQEYYMAGLTFLTRCSEVGLFYH